MVRGATLSADPSPADLQDDSEAEAGAPSDAGEARLEGPPRIPLAFRVGVVGHRPDRLRHADPEALAAAIGSILGAVRDEVQRVAADHPELYAPGAPLLRALTPLAEGADRIFAEQALACGFQLCCVLPFPRAEFARDFLPPSAQEEGSLERFERLLAKATTVFELDGSRADEGRAYGACGRVVLNQSDLLVVVWDGERLGKSGGTEETLDEAVRLGVPVVRIEPLAPKDWKMPSGEALRAAVRRALEVPRKEPDESEPGVLRALFERFARLLNELGPDGLPQPGARSEPLEQYRAERQPQTTSAVLWKAFRDVVADGKVPEVQFEVTPFERAVMKEWPRCRWSALARLVDDLRPHYAWPDRLAVLYAERYRSAFLSAFLLAAFAVGMALLPLWTPHSWEAACSVVELAVILLILVLVGVGRRCRWHERWLDYRLTAELVRHLRVVAPLGGARPFQPLPDHWADGRPGATWMAWHARALERFLSLPQVVVDATHLQACLRHLRKLLCDQRIYHRETARRCHRLEQRLHRLGMTCLALTLLCCGLHLVVSDEQGLSGFLTFLCGFLPALGAALAGINTQGEFRRIARRSEAMKRALRAASGRVNRMRRLVGEHPQRQHSPQVAELADEVARLLVNEVLDWRVVFLDRPLHPPA